MAAEPGETTVEADSYAGNAFTEVVGENGHAVADVTLVRGDDWRVVSKRLD